MEGELWPILYAWVVAEAKLRPRPRYEAPDSRGAGKLFAGDLSDEKR